MHLQTYEVGHANRGANLPSIADSSFLSSQVTGGRDTAGDVGDEAGVCANALRVEIALCGQSSRDTASSALGHTSLGCGQRRDGKESESGGTHVDLL